VSVPEILDRALDGERISDADAAELLRSRDLVAVGRAAHELRNRRSDPGVVTFIVLNASAASYPKLKDEYASFVKSLSRTK